MILRKLLNKYRQIAIITKIKAIIKIKISKAIEVAINNLTRKVMLISMEVIKIKVKILSIIA